MPQLECDGRFYRGFNMKVILVMMIIKMIMIMMIMKLEDSGQISLIRPTSGAAPAPSALCLFKFYPASDCVIRSLSSSLSLSLD